MEESPLNVYSLYTNCAHTHPTEVKMDSLGSVPGFISVYYLLFWNLPAYLATCPATTRLPAHPPPILC